MNLKFPNMQLEYKKMQLEFKTGRELEYVHVLHDHLQQTSNVGGNHMETMASVEYVLRSLHCVFWCSIQ